MESIETAIAPLAALPSEARRALAHRLLPRDLEKDEYLFFEDDPADAVYLIGMGKIKILKHSESGKDLVLEVLSGGEMLGELGVLTSERHRVAAQAMEPTRVWGMSREEFQQVLLQYPTLAAEVARSLAKRLEDAYDMMQSLAVERVERRIARVLLKLAAATGERTSEGIVIGTPLTRQDVADMTGTTVETAIRVMSRFTKKGIVRSRRGRVILLQPHQLVLIAEEV